MSDTTGTDLEAVLSEATEHAEAALDAATDGTLPDEEADALRDRVGEVAEATADATFDELLDAAGFEDLPADVSPVDLPTLVQEASSEAVIELRRLLELADLGEEWTDLDDEERIDRLERIVTSDGDDDSRSVGELLSTVWSAVESDGDEADESEDRSEETAAGETADGTGESGEDGAEAETDEPDVDVVEMLGSGDSLEDEMARLRSRLESIAANAGDAAESDDEADEESDGDREDGGRSSVDNSRSRLSTMPSSRPDMGRSTRLSTTWRGK